MSAVTLAWLILFVGAVFERTEGRDDRAQTRRDLAGIDLSLRALTALKVLGLDESMATAFGPAEDALGEGSLDDLTSTDAVQRKVLALLLEGDAPSEEVVGEAHSLLLETAERHSAPEFEAVAVGMAPDAGDEEVASALAVLREWEPLWLGKATAWRLATYAGMDVEARGYRVALRARSAVFLLAISVLVVCLLIGALVGVFLLPVHIGLRIYDRRHALPPPSFLLPEYAPDPSQPPRASVASDPVDFLPLPQEAPAAHHAHADAVTQARWSVLAGIECVTLLFVGQAAFGLLVRSLTPSQELLRSPMAALVISVGGGLVAALYGLWRIRQAGQGQLEAMGLGPMPWWRAVGWGVAGYWCAVPVMFAVAYVVSKLAGESYSVNPALDITERMSSAADIAAMFLVIVVGAPFIEEIVFRGALYAPVRRRAGAAAAIVVTGLGFAAIHLDPLVGPQLAVIGVALAYVRERTGSLYPCMILHALQNGFAFAMICTMKL